MHTEYEVRVLKIEEKDAANIDVQKIYSNYGYDIETMKELRFKE